jgi:cytochrome bd ubiquinol oxidase subunit II
VLGYALLGAGWLVLKSQGELRDWAYRRIEWLVGRVVVVLFVAFTVTFDYSILARNNLHARSWGLMFPSLGALALANVVMGARLRRDGMPFTMTVLFFVAAFLSLAVMFWPYLIPYSVTLANAAAPDASLRLLFYGALLVLPIVAVYTIGVYWVIGGIGKNEPRHFLGNY